MVAGEEGKVCFVGYCWLGVRRERAGVAGVVGFVDFVRFTPA